MKPWLHRHSPASSSTASLEANEAAARRDLPAEVIDLSAGAFEQRFPTLAKRRRS